MIDLNSPLLDLSAHILEFNFLKIFRSEMREGLPLLVFTQGTKIFQANKSAVKWWLLKLTFRKFIGLKILNLFRRYHCRQELVINHFIERGA